MKAKRICALVVIAAVALTAALPAFAEEEAKEIGRWYLTLETGVNLLQSSYSENWNGGDKGSVVWSWLLNSTAHRKFSDTLDWSSSLKLAFGQTHQQERGADGKLVWNRPDKTTDLIDFESILRWNPGVFVDPYMSGRLESRFLDESDPDGRGLSFNPMTISEAAGVSHQFIEEEHRNLTSRFGFSFRQNRRTVFTDPAPVDDTTTENTNDGGLELITDYKDRIAGDKVAWTSRLSFFQPVFYSGKDALDDLTPVQIEAAGLAEDIADYTTTMDIEWENIFTTRITKVISVNFYLRWVYDKYDNTVKPLLNETEDGLANADAVAAAVRKAGQFKQTMAIGVTYSFF